MNNVVDEVLDLNSTDGVVKYKITHEDGTIEYVQIELETDVTIQGTPQNKALFDSIKNDLNSRLLKANKATQAQAEAGTNNVNYMTALMTAKAIQALSPRIHVAVGTIANGQIIPQTAGYQNYYYFVSPYEIESPRIGVTSNIVDNFWITCEVNQTTRRVTCSMGSRAGSVAGTANYIEIAWN